MPYLGRAALVVSLALVLYAALAGGYAAFRGRRRLLESARNALYDAIFTLLAWATFEYVVTELP